MARREDDELFDSLSAPLHEMILSVARGVADAQQAMDMRTIEAYKDLYGGDDGLRRQLQALGYQPTWYRIPELNAEMTISLSISEHSDIHGNAEIGSPEGIRPLKMYAAPIDANYSNRYNYDIKAASKISFKIVPVPPSAQAEQIRVVPQLKGKNLAEVKNLLGVLNIQFSSEGEGTVSEVQPASGTILRAGEKVIIKFSA
ncbi:MAG: PASTA domain-containing protein [Phaeodactylibacter sp.]|nr:PASTA domain-containing protein [Phaeodactylibacter sp.]MCB9299229.1 PASTA domain-containing protein [Lewinellaceae bacterium]